MLDSFTPLFISRRFHLLHYYWISSCRVVGSSFMSPSVVVGSFHHQRDDTATAFFLTPSSTSTTRHYRHCSHDHNGLLYHSLYPRIVSSSSLYASAIPSTTTTASTWHGPLSGWYSLTLKATPRGPWNNHQNRRQHSRPAPQQFLSVNGVLDDYVRNRNNLKPYQVGLVWNKLGKAIQQSRSSNNTRERRNFWADHAANLQTLIAHTIQVVDDFNGQSTATVTHSLAKLMSLTDSNLGRVQSLWNALLLRTAVHLESNKFNPQDLANTAWAFATLNREAPTLFDAIARSAQACIADFNPQALANTAWAFATLNHEAPTLFDAIAKAAKVCIADFKPQNLANTAWAFATLNHKAPQLLDAIAISAQKRIDEFNPQAISNTACAFAKLNHNAPPLLDAIAISAQKRIDEFNPQNLANTAWAFATLNHEAPTLFDAIARSARERIDEFNPQALANTAWAFATLNHNAPPLLDAIAISAQTRIDDFNPQALSNTAWAFATLEHDVPMLFDSIAKAAKVCIGDFKPQALSNTAWAFASLNQEATLLFDAIARSAEMRLEGFNPQSLANTAWAFAVLDVKTNLLTDADSPFAKTLLSTDPTSFNVEDLFQLHQYHLWCREQNTSSWFSDELKSRCMDAFVSQEGRTSRLQNDVVASLETLQEVSQLKEEFHTNIGYSLDAVIVYRENMLGVEVDGPSHFLGRSPRTPRYGTPKTERQQE